jgi:uncharacterized protein YcbK (DUF882 family)
MITKSKFACKCCKSNLITQEVITLCEKIEKKVGYTLTINSGYRCSKHNTSVGGKLSSQHLKGKAADITCSNLTKLKKVCKEMWDAKEIGGYGKNYNTFVHVDTGSHRSW